jgi:hypothetical protein
LDRVTALHVQRSSDGRLAKDQTTRSVLIIWVVFDDPACRYRLAQLLHNDAPDNALVNSVLRQLELIRRDLPS